MLWYGHMKELLKKLPSVDDILKENRVLLWLEAHPRVLVLDAIRSALDSRRRSILQSVDTPASLDEQSLSLAAIIDLTLTNQVTGGAMYALSAHDPAQCPR